MSGPPSQRSLVCEEVFDERSQPTEEEVREFAVKIGIDPDVESHLLPLAREGLLKPLPKNWKPVYDSNTKQYYYFNFKTKQTSWEHPLDNKFRDLVKKSRSESLSSAGEEDSKTSIKEDLKSFEEAATSVRLESDSTKDSLMDFSSHGVPALKSSLSPLRTNKKEESESFSIRKERKKSSTGRSELKPVFTPKPLFSQSLRESSMSSDFSRNKPSKAGWDDLSSYLNDDSEPLQEIPSHKSGRDPKYLTSLDYSLMSHDQNLDSLNSSTIGRFTVDRVRKIDIDSQTKRLDSDGSENVQKSSDRLLRSGYGQPEFTLSGGGSVFLKSNKKKTEAKGEDELSKLKSNSGFETNALRGVDFSLKSGDQSAQEMSPRNLKSSIQSSTSSPTASAASTRSILRTPQGEKRLWDVDPQHMSVSEKALWKQQELEEEKKSVRFNLDKELNISFKLSDSSDSDSSSEHQNVDEDYEEPEWNSRSSEELAMELKMLQNDTSNPQQALKKKRLSPLEEWAQETWFSKKSPSEDRADAESKDFASALHSTSDFGQLAGSLSQRMEESHDFDSQTETGRSPDSHERYTPMASERKNIGVYKSLPQVSLGDESRNDVPNKHNAKPSHELQSGEVVSLSNVDDLFRSSELEKSLSPIFQESDSPESNFVASITKKLESMATAETFALDITSTREASAREQALRDWNVKKIDNDMHRPPLSRQQSQHQLQQVKQQMKEPAKKEDRDRALREWNVTHTMNESVKSASRKLVAGHQADKTTAILDTGLETSNSLDEKLRASPIINNNESSGSDKNITKKDGSLKVSNEGAAVTEDFGNKLAVSIEKIKLEYEIQLMEKEHEYKLKFEQDEQNIIKSYQEKLEKRVEEETRNADLKCKEIISQMERDSDNRMKQVREQLEHKQTCASQKILEQHQQALAAQEVENQAAMLRIREQHSAEMKALREQFLREEEQIRREHHDRIVSLREDRDGKRGREITDHLRAIEKLRCEKRLVEDKYRTLKEKYIKLKGEIKSNLEKKEPKPKENQEIENKGGPSQSNGTEQEASVSNMQQHSDRSSETDTRLKTASAGSSGTSNSLGFHQLQSQTRPQEPLNPILDPPSPAPNSAPSAVTSGNKDDGKGPNVSFLGMNFSNPSFQENHFSTNQNGLPSTQSPWCNIAQIKVTERNGNIPTASQENRGPQNYDEKVKEFSPLEALRHQLQTLDELEEQFPASSATDAYLRYPFTDSGTKELGSAELEFVRHRIHLERDMIRKAKTSLQAQQTEYRSRMHNFQQLQAATIAASPSTTLYQMAKEEQELSDMEAKLRQTRTILGEKVIHLRHLENSLNRLTSPGVKPEIHGKRTNGLLETRYSDKARVKHHRRWDWKNGGSLALEDDVSSDSGGSSGFSSTEYTSDGTLASILSHSGSGQRFKRPPENAADINASLHNLNAEISEIWNVLCKQRAAAGLGPPPLLSTQAATWISPTNSHFATPVTSARPGSVVMVPSSSKVTFDKNSSLIERTNNLRQWLQKAKINATSNPARAANDVAF